MIQVSLIHDLSLNGNLATAGFMRLCHFLVCLRHVHKAERTSQQQCCVWMHNSQSEERCKMVVA